MYYIITWAVIIAFVIMMYVLLDGFDLGIGILYPFINNRDHRTIMLSTIAPVWDGNETWLVMGGASLYAAFPVVYSTVLPALYLPLIVMLVALIFRGVAFEFHFKAQRSRILWEIAFNLGSTIAAFAQGIVLGAFIQGFHFKAGVPITSGFTWLTPFSIFTGFAVVCGYALLGATWLIIKTIDELQQKMFALAKKLLVIVALFLVIVSVWTPFIQPTIKARWFSLPNFYYLLPLPIISAAIIFLGMLALYKRYEKTPFYCAVGIFWCAYVGFGISIWPHIVPYKITIWQAASPLNSLKFTLVGAVIMLPILLCYNAYAYRIFKGKVSTIDQVHHY